MYEPAPSVERAPARAWLPRTRLLELDTELVLLAQGAAALRLGVGEALAALTAVDGPRRLGFSSSEAYARERCEQSGRWARDARALARRLSALPEMRAAVLTGELSWSMAELLSRHCDSDCEHELVSEGRGKTVRQMRAALRRQAETPEQAAGETSVDGDGSEPEPLVRLTVTMTSEEAWAFECTRMLVELLGGGRSDDNVVDCLLAEGMSTLLGAVPGGADELEHSLECAPFADERRAAQHRQWRQQLAEWRDEAERLCEGRIPRRDAGPAEIDGLVPPPGELPADEVELDRHIARLSKMLLRRDVQLGDGLRRLCDGNGWRRLGYASLGQYARERLGVSLSSAKARMTLSRRTEQLEPLREAVETGAVGFEAAVLVSRVATPKTVEAWLSRARERTIKHLGEEVGTAELIARTSGEAEQPPPDGQTQAAMMALESYVLSGRVFRGEPEQGTGQMSVSADTNDTATPLAAGQMSVGAETIAAKPRRGAGKVAMRWRVAADVARAWHALKQLHRRSRFGGSLVEFLCAALWKSWMHTLDPEVAYGDIYARERYRCSSPVCFSRNQTPHHIVFRAHGGDDSPENLTAPCAACHLDGIHAGNVEVDGPASNPRWRLGREPLLEVHGRLRRQA